MKSIWTVLGLAAAITFLSMVSGKLSGKMMVAIGALVIIGAVYPPLGVGMGIVILLYVLLVDNGAALGWFQNRLGKGGSKS